MNILLDTNAFIWFSEDDRMLSRKAKYVLENSENILYISVVTFWELAIKKSIKKIEMSLSLNDLYKKTKEVGFRIQAIEFSHILLIETLPYYHKDPFDRLLIAQAIEENMVIVSSDIIIKRYGVKQIW